VAISIPHSSYDIRIYIFTCDVHYAYVYYMYIIKLHFIYPERRPSEVVICIYIELMKFFTGVTNE